MPAADEGRQPTAPGEVLISTRLTGYGIGDQVDVAGTPLTVVGTRHDSTALAGTPNLFVLLADAQKIGFAGLPVVSAVAVHGTPDAVPDGFTIGGNDIARADLLRAIAKAKSSITLITVLLWLVAASIIGAVVYLTALERQRDFAVFKATGVATRSILAGMVLQAAILAIAAALVGSVIASLLGPRFPMIVALELRAHLLLPVFAVLVGTIASVGGMRRVISVDPALAFGGP
jgi:putative ABC transport system permease protein